MCVCACFFFIIVAVHALPYSKLEWFFCWHRSLVRPFTTLVFYTFWRSLRAASTLFSLRDRSPPAHFAATCSSSTPGTCVEPAAFHFLSFACVGCFASSIRRFSTRSGCAFAIRIRNECAKTWIIVLFASIQPNAIQLTTHIHTYRIAAAASEKTTTIKTDESREERWNIYTDAHWTRQKRKQQRTITKPEKAKETSGRMWRVRCSGEATVQLRSAWKRVRMAGGNWTGNWNATAESHQHKIKFKLKANISDTLF